MNMRQLENGAFELLPPESVKNLLESTLDEAGIPACPFVLKQVHIEMAKDDPDLNLLARVISSDVALAGGVIAIANSPYFGFHSRVRSITEALMVLGLDVACRAISGIVLRKLFPVTLEMERFWDASAGIARLSGWLAQHPDMGIKLHASDAYTFGLFRDCGIAVLLNRFRYYQEVLKQANAEKIMGFTQIEETKCPTNHALIGSLLAQSWWLPDEISSAIRLHHEYAILQGGDSTLLTPEALALIATSQLAEHIFQYHTGMQKSQEWYKASEACLRLLEIREEQLENLYEESAPVLAKYD